MVVARYLRTDVAVHLRTFRPLRLQHRHGLALVLGEVHASRVSNDASGDPQVGLAIVASSAGAGGEGSHRRVVLHVRSDGIEVVAARTVTHS
ncbi:hypothetical protein D3C78_1316760 [compost metagenome]